MNKSTSERDLNRSLNFRLYQIAERDAGQPAASDAALRPTYSIRDLLGVLWRRKGLILLVFLVVSAALFAVFRSSTPIYEASSTLVVQIGREYIYEPESGSAVVTAGREQVVNSQLFIMQSEDIVRQAVQEVGPERLYPAEGDEPVTDQDRAYLNARGALTVEVFSNTELIRVAFRHADPAVGAEFVNRLVSIYLARHAALYNDPRQIEFYVEQKARYDEDAEQAAAALLEFAGRSRVYSFEDEMALLLEHRSALAAAATATQSALAENRSRAESVRSQLEAMEPSANDSYQLTAALLVTVSADVAGLTALAQEHRLELENVEEELRRLAATQAEFDRLQRDVDTAEANATAMGSALAAANLDLARSAERLSSIRVVQQAVTPLEPVFPQPKLFVGFGILGGLMMGIGAALLREALARPRYDLVAA